MCARQKICWPGSLSSFGNWLKWFQFDLLKIITCTLSFRSQMAWKRDKESVTIQTVLTNNNNETDQRKIVGFFANLIRRERHYMQRKQNGNCFTSTSEDSMENLIWRCMFIILWFVHRYDVNITTLFSLPLQPLRVLFPRRRDWRWHE